MINEQIMTYVAGERTRGVADDAIRGALLSQGWKVGDVDGAMGGGVVAVPTGPKVFSFMNLFEGRLGRWQYFVNSFIFGLVFFALIFFLAILVSADVIPKVVDKNGWILFVFALPFYVSFNMRRLHDLNWTGWYMLLALVPIANIVIGIIMLFKKGTEGPNKYGPPQANRNFKNTLLNL